MKIALASPPFPHSIKEGLLWVEKLTAEAVQQGAEIVCFPESYIPGYPWWEYEHEKGTPEILKAALDEVGRIAAANNIMVIMPMDWYENGELLNTAQVISAKGEVLGYQTKNQLDPSEDTIWAAGTQRELFEVNGVTFGITICHEGFRYPESVRWAAARGAQIVFHPHFTGSDISGSQLTEWGAKSNPYYEKAMMMRAMENTIYFASVGYAMKYPESATCVVAPDGSCVAYQPYCEAGVIVTELDLNKATGLLAKRFKAGLVQ